MENKIKGMKIINILDFNKMDKQSLQKNVATIYENMGEQFIIKFNTHLIIAGLFRNKNLTNEKEFFRLYYEGEIVGNKFIKRKNTTQNLFPFIIDFIDPITCELNNNAYINNIHKTDNITGSEMVELVKKICDVIGVKKVYLLDKTSVVCNGNTLNLSLFKLIEKGRTFYSKFGFEFDINNYYNLYTNKFDNIKQLDNKINSLIDNIRKIKTKDLIKFAEELLEILELVVKNQDYNNLTIKKSYTSIKDIHADVFEISDPKNNINQLFGKLHNLLMILLEVKEEYFYHFLIETFNNSKKAHLYKETLDYLTLDGIYSVKYNDKELVNNFDLYFQNLNSIQRNHFYSYEFK